MAPYNPLTAGEESRPPKNRNHPGFNVLEMGTYPMRSSSDSYLRNLYPYGSDGAFSNTFQQFWDTYGGQIGGTPESHYYDWIKGFNLPGVNKTLNDYYGSGGEYYNGLFMDLFGKDHIGPSEDSLFDYFGVKPIQQQSEQPQQSDPFLDFLMNQMGIAGIGQQAPQQAPTNQYQQILATLRGADPLLSSLLGMLQLQPQPPPPVSNQRYGGF